MVPEEEQIPSLQELSSLEVEPLETFVYPSESQQDNNLYTLTTAPSEAEIVALLTDHSSIRGSDCYCCCCCPACCC
jgi:hypothetical protein